MSSTNSNSCWSSALNYPSFSNVEIEQEFSDAIPDFLFKNNAFYSGRTVVNKTGKYPKGATLYNVLATTGAKRTQALNTYRQFEGSAESSNVSYNVKSSFIESLMGKQYRRNTTNGHGWILTRIAPQSFSNGVKTEIYEGEGVNEFLATNAVVRLRLERTTASNDPDTVIHKTYYRGCQNNGTWILITTSVYTFSCFAE